MTKKVLSIILALILLLSVCSILPMTASAEEADVADTGAALTISNDLPSGAVISVNNSSAVVSNPFLVFSVTGGTGAYTYDWYLNRNNEFSDGSKIATTTVPVYQATEEGYYYCVAKDSSSASVTTSKTHVYRQKVSDMPKARVKATSNDGTKLEWFASPTEDSRSTTFYLSIFRYDTTHNTSERWHYFFIDAQNGLGNYYGVKLTGAGGYLTESELNAYHFSYDGAKHLYSIDMRGAIKNQDNLYSDIEYSYTLNESKIDPDSPCFEVREKANEIYYASSTVTTPNTDYEHYGEVQIMDGVYQPGDYLTANLNGGRWANQAANVDVVVQHKTSGGWTDYRTTDSNLRYKIMSTDAGETLRLKLVPKAGIGRVAGEYYWDDEYFYSNEITVPDNKCTVSFDSNGGTGTMAPVKVDKGSTYTLPECTFTPPANKVFSKWAVNGSIPFGNVTQITVNEDTVLEAQWKDAPSGTYSISGGVTSYLEASDNTSIMLSKKSGDNYALQGVRTISGNSGSYSFTGLSNGQYKLSVRKTNHVTREYNVTILLGSKTQDVKICPIGDTNNDGSVKANDAMAAYRHARGESTITDPYKFACANVAGNDSYIKANDAMQIYRQAQGKHSLF